MRKMLVSDYDDTFYISDEDILNNISLIDKNHDNFLFVIATGRSYYDYNKKKTKYNIKSDYIILNHGATILKDEKIISNISISNNIKNNLIDDLQIDNAINCFACKEKESRVSLDSSNLTKINVKYPSREYTLKIYENIKNKYSDYVNCFLISGDFAIEIVSNLVDKKDAILKIIEIESIDYKVYTVGNGDTDYNMLKYFNGYAMENSTNKIGKLNLKKIKSVSEIIEQISK